MNSRPLFRFGNSKLPRSTAIFNMGPVSNGRTGRGFRFLCPEYRAGTCQLPNPRAYCYALWPELWRRHVYPYRMRQRAFWRTCTPDTFVDAFLQAAGRRQVTAFRWNEAGGIADRGDIDKMDAIAWRLPELPFYIYTSRRDLWDAGAFENLAPNLCVVGSGFCAHNAFVTVDQIPARVTRCVSDCSRCSLCVTRRGATVYAKLH
jgi:hypothetical protein